MPHFRTVHRGSLSPAMATDALGLRRWFGRRRHEEARYDGVGVRHAGFSRVVEEEDRKHSITLKRWGTSASAFLEFTVMANSCPRPVRPPSVLFADGSDDDLQI